MILFAHTKFSLVRIQGSRVKRGGGIRPPRSERVFQIPVQIGLNFGAGGRGLGQVKYFQKLIKIYRLLINLSKSFREAITNSRKIISFVRNNRTVFISNQ